MPKTTRKYARRQFKVGLSSNNDSQERSSRFLRSDLMDISRKKERFGSLGSLKDEREENSSEKSGIAGGVDAIEAWGAER